MANTDLGFLRLRNLTAHQPDGSKVPANQILTTGENGASVFSNSPNLSTITLSTLMVNRTADIGGEATFRQTLTSQNKLTVISGGADIGGNSIFNDKLSTMQKLTVVEGGADIGGLSVFKDNLSTIGVLNALGGVNITGDAIFKNNLSTTGTLDVAGVTNLRNTLTVAGLTTLKNNLSITGTLDVQDVTNLRSKLTVTTGGADITGPVAVTGATNITGNTKVTGTLESTGNLNVSAGNATIANGLTVLSGGATVTGTTNVTGATNITGNTKVTGTLESTGNLNVSAGNATIANGLTVTNGGATVTSGNITVTSGNVAVGGIVDSDKLRVYNGTTSLGGKLTVTTGGADITGTLSTIGNTRVTQTLIASSIITERFRSGLTPNEGFAMTWNELGGGNAEFVAGRGGGNSGAFKFYTNVANNVAATAANLAFSVNAGGGVDVIGTAYIYNNTTSNRLTINGNTADRFDIEATNNTNTVKKDITINAWGTGNVSIGTPDPAGYKLRVAGTANITDAVTLGQNLTVSGTGTFNGINVNNISSGAVVYNLTAGDGILLNGATGTTAAGNITISAASKNGIEIQPWNSSNIADNYGKIAVVDPTSGITNIDISTSTPSAGTFINLINLSPNDITVNYAGFNQTLPVNQKMELVYYSNNGISTWLNPTHFINPIVLYPPPQYMYINNDGAALIDTTNNTRYNTYSLPVLGRYTKLHYILVGGGGSGGFPNSKDGEVSNWGGGGGGSGQLTASFTLQSSNNGFNYNIGQNAVNESVIQLDQNVGNIKVIIGEGGEKNNNMFIPSINRFGKNTELIIYNKDGSIRLRKTVTGGQGGLNAFDSPNGGREGGYGGYGYNGGGGGSGGGVGGRGGAGSTTRGGAWGEDGTGNDAGEGGGLGGGEGPYSGDGSGNNAGGGGGGGPGITNTNTGGRGAAVYIGANDEAEQNGVAWTGAGGGGSAEYIGGNHFDNGGGGRGYAILYFGY
jgi:hypothetical protein